MEYKEAKETFETSYSNALENQLHDLNPLKRMYSYEYAHLLTQLNQLEEAEKIIDKNVSSH